MKKLSLIILALLAALVSCKKAPEVNLKYVDVEREVLTIGTTTATFQCDYQYIATLKSAKIYYGLSESGMSSKEMQVVSSSLYAEITGLVSSTAYNYYYEFYNGYNSMQSAVKSFTTESTPVTLPTVITADVTEITAESAVSGGNVTNDGGGTVTARGVCWSTSLNPTINDSFTTDGEGIGSFISNMTGLSGNITYHVRAYATNEAGTAYGLDKTFTTLNGGGGGDAPTGAINGLFTINANGDQVYFSQGNLQYQASTNTWRFAEHQWDYVGGTENGIEYGSVYENGVKCDNALISQTYNGWIDLFGWGTGDDPTKASTHYTDYSIFVDWGNNAIINGGNATGTWYTLATDEWNYITYNRNTSSGIRYAKAKIGEINGLILLPDNWDISFYGLNNTDDEHASYEDNIISSYVWATELELYGAVFLPAAGQRHGVIAMPSGGLEGMYYSATAYNNEHSYGVYFHKNAVSAESIGIVQNGLSVRLVQNAE